MFTSPQPPEHARPTDAARRVRDGALVGATIVAGSILSGLLAAIALLVFPFAGAAENGITAAVLLGFAIGWALLAALSTHFTHRPQHWATIPAATLATSAAGLVVLSPGDASLTALGWVWPPLLLALVIWIAAHVRDQPAASTGLWLLYPVLAVMTLIAVGGVYETLHNVSASAVANAPGHRLVDVGGHRLDILCTGSGSPTVVLEPGLGESASAMARRIAPDVARTTRICVYDQAGHGRSDAATANHSDAARDLHVLLARRHIPAPYILVGHSLGGAFALTYTHRYPAQVAGLVLLDSMYPHQSSAFAGMDPLLAIVPTLARTGLARLLFDEKDGSPQTQASQLVRDIAEMPAELNRAAKVTTLGNLPLAVVTAGRDYQTGWLVHQDALASLSTNTVHRIVAGSTHTSLINDPADATQSSRAIRDIVRAARTSRDH
jgi:pimeloyl-ACP methyl ester carboxylesterase